jgi:predicted nuclease with TOPRIM domain
VALCNSDVRDHGNGNLEKVAVEETKKEERIFGMAEHIEDLQQRYAELKKRVDLVRSYL